jgi:hypothetical protein
MLLQRDITIKTRDPYVDWQSDALWEGHESWGLSSRCSDRGIDCTWVLQDGICISVSARSRTNRHFLVGPSMQLPYSVEELRYLPTQTPGGKQACMLSDLARVQ